MLIKNGNNIISSNTGIVQEDKYLVGHGTPYIGTTIYFYLNLQVTDDITVDWGDGNTTTMSWVGTSNPAVIGSISHNYEEDGTYMIRLIYDNFENVTGIGLYGVLGITDYYKKLPNLKTFYFKNFRHEEKRNEYINFNNNPNITYIYNYYTNTLLDYDSVPDDIPYFINQRYYYDDIKQVANLTEKLSNMKNLEILDLSNQHLITADLSVLSGNTGLTNFSFYQTKPLFSGDVSFLKYNDGLRTLRLNGSAASLNFKGHTFNETLFLVILNNACEWNLDEIFNSYDLTYSANRMSTGASVISGHTSDIDSVHPELTTLFIYLFDLTTSYVWGDILPFNRIKSTYRFQLNGINLYGDINSLNQPHITPTSIFSLKKGKFYGDCTFMSGITALYIYMNTMTKHDTQSFSNMEYIVDHSNRRTIYLQDSDLTTLELDSVSNKLFSNRAIYNTTVTKNYKIEDNTGYPTGTYQEPNKGSYTGNTNDLTETEITNLSIGDDYDGQGTNTPWTILEKIWILVNLDISSSNPTTRYYWTITY